MRAFIFPGQGSQSVGMGTALAGASRRGARRLRGGRRGARPESVAADGRGAGRGADADRERPAGDHGQCARDPARLRHRPRRQGRFRRRPQPWRIFGAVRGRHVRSRHHRAAAQAARPGDAGGGAGRARGRWRPCSAPTSPSPRRSPTKRREGEVCTIANDNDPSQIVISGHRAAIERALVIAKEKGAKRAMLLPVSAPFHCPLMQPAAEAMAEALAGVAMEPPAVSLYANVTAAPVDSPDTIRELLVEQVTGRVRWRESVAAMAEAGRHPFRRVRRQGAGADGQAHRARRPGDQRRVDGGHRRAGEGNLRAQRKLPCRRRRAARQEDRAVDRALRPGRLDAAGRADDVAGGQRDDVVEADRVANVAGERLREGAVAAARPGAVERDLTGSVEKTILTPLSWDRAMPVFMDAESSSA